MVVAEDLSKALVRSRQLHARALRVRDEARAARHESQRLRVAKLLATTSRHPVIFPVAHVSRGPRGLVATSHAVDGDGSAVCGQYPKEELTQFPGLAWADVPDIAACPLCWMVARTR